MASGCDSRGHSAFDEPPDRWDDDTDAGAFVLLRTSYLFQPDGAGLPGSVAVELDATIRRARVLTGGRVMCDGTVRVTTSADDDVGPGPRSVSVVYVSFPADSVDSYRARLSGLLDGPFTDRHGGAERDRARVTVTGPLRDLDARLRVDTGRWSPRPPADLGNIPLPPWAVFSPARSRALAAAFSGGARAVVDHLRHQESIPPGTRAALDRLVGPRGSVRGGLPRGEFPGGESPGDGSARSESPGDRSPSSESPPVESPHGPAAEGVRGMELWVDAGDPSGSGVLVRIPIEAMKQDRR